MGERFDVQNINLDVRPTGEDVGERIKDGTKFAAQEITTAKVIEEENYETDTEVDTEAESTTSILDFDSLSIVFSYLDIRDRMAVGAVCRRWRLTVCEAIWNRVKRLDLSQNSFRRFKIPVFIRLCPNVTEIVVHFIKDDGISAAIAESCPRLERLTVIHLDCSSQECNLEDLSRIPLQCPHLKAFHFEAQHGASFINQFVKNVQELEEITIKGRITEKTNWLGSLSKPLKSLHLTEDKVLGRHVIKYVKKHGDHLTSLTLAPSERSLSNRQVKKILSRTPNLTQLNLTAIHFEYAAENDFSHEIAQLKDLTRLSLASDVVDYGVFFDNVVKGCSKLSHLDLSGTLSSVIVIRKLAKEIRTIEITGCKDLDLGNFEFEIAVPSLVDLENLVSLNLSRLMCISEVLPRLTACVMRLKELILVETHIKDEDVFTIMMHGAALEYLDVSENDYLTNASVDFACDIIMNNPSRPKLVIRAFSCGLMMSNRSADADVADRIHFDLGDTA